MSVDFKSLELRLAAAGSGNPKRAVEELAAHVLGCRPLEIYFREFLPEQAAELDALIVRAEQGEPVQYIIGHVDFRGLEVACDPRALIPRPETELLVEQVLQAVSNFKFQVSSFLRVADVCTGTGCVGLALAHELPNAVVTAIDISQDALSLAKENAQRQGLSDRFQCLENDLLDGFAERSLDAVVSNPPYILSNAWKTLDASVKEFEPQLALDGGEDGMNLIRPLVAQAARVLKPGGGLFLEIGYDQGGAVFQTLENAGFEQVRIVKDFAGLDRIVTGQTSKGV
jgi:release factor glutamine methyltransferase